MTRFVTLSAARVTPSAARGLLLLVLMSLPLADATAQREFRGRRGGFYGGDPTDFYTPPDFRGNVPYDGRFTFARIKYRGFEHFMNEGPGWSHDYPRAEEHLMRIVREISALKPFVEKGPMVGGVIVALDDKELFKYPVAYLSEPGGWHPNAEEMAGMRNYLLKGGFIIFDDFNGRGGDWERFRETMGQVMPKHRLIPVPEDHPVFDSFFKIDLKILEHGDYGQTEYWGIFQDNDPKKRLMSIVNLNGDIGEAWQWSDRGYAIAPANESYKLGVNYLIYALTH